MFKKILLVIGLLTFTNAFALKAIAHILPSGDSVTDYFYEDEGASQDVVCLVHALYNESKLKILVSGMVLKEDNTRRIVTNLTTEWLDFRFTKSNNYAGTAIFYLFNEGYFPIEYSCYSLSSQPALDKS
jgi:hypothetical protein